MLLENNDGITFVLTHSASGNVQHYKLRILKWKSDRIRLKILRNNESKIVSRTTKNFIRFFNFQTFCGSFRKIEKLKLKIKLI